MLFSPFSENNLCSYTPFSTFQNFSPPPVTSRLLLRTAYTGNRMYSDDSSVAAPSNTLTTAGTFASLIQEKGVIIGAAVSVGSTLCAQVVARAGFDWTLIDMEHAPTSPREATNITHAVVAASGGSCLPIIRTPSHGVEWIKWALDSGARGVIIPMVTSAKECEDIIQRAVYPPLGQRSLGHS